MARLLAILTIFLAIALFPPAVLALLSNNAVPGDRTYPIKRALEDIVYAISSVNPTSKAWFSAARSDRRFEEISVLVAQKKSTSETIIELVNQTKISADQIKDLGNGIEKKQLADKFNASVQKYVEKLKEYSKESESEQVEVLPMPTPTPASTISPLPTTTPTSIPTPIPTPYSTATPAHIPSPTTRPSSTPAPPVIVIPPQIQRDNCYHQWLTATPPNWAGWAACVLIKTQVNAATGSSFPSPAPSPSPSFSPSPSPSPRGMRGQDVGEAANKPGLGAMSFEEPPAFFKDQHYEDSTDSGIEVSPNPSPAASAQ